MVNTITKNSTIVSKKQEIWLFRSVFTFLILDDLYYFNNTKDFL